MIHGETHTHKICGEKGTGEAVNTTAEFAHGSCRQTHTFTIIEKKSRVREKRRRD